MRLKAGKWAGLVLALVACVCFAQGAPRRIAGDVVRFDGGMLTVKSASGAEETVKLAPKARITTRAKTDLDHVQQGHFVGVTAVPRDDGTLVASEIQIFPESMRGTGEGHRPMERTNTMTNATVSAVARGGRATSTEGTIGNVAQAGGEHRMILTYKDGQKSVIAPPNTLVMASDIGEPSALTPGAHVVVYATTQADGSLGTDRVSVGMGGFVPPR